MILRDKFAWEAVLALAASGYSGYSLRDPSVMVADAYRIADEFLRRSQTHIPSAAELTERTRRDRE